MKTNPVNPLRLAIGRLLWWFVGPAHREADQIAWDNSVNGRIARRREEDFKAESERLRRTSSEATASRG